MKKPLVLWLCLAFSAPVFSAAGDEAVLAARDAFRDNDVARLSRLDDDVPRGHELSMYVDYWRLAAQLNLQGTRRAADPDAAAIREFLARHKGSFAAEKLRVEWLKYLARNALWTLFDLEWPNVQQPDQEASCFALQSRLRRGDAGALDVALPLWKTTLDLPESCRPLLAPLVQDGRMRADDMWLRIRRAVEEKRLSAARYAAAWLLDQDAPDARALEQIIDNPARYLDRLSPQFSTTRRGRELALAAASRLARVDIQSAVRHWESIDHRFGAEERAYVAGQLGWHLARAHDPAAVRWFKAAAGAPMVEEQRAWQVRAALRAGDWRQVRAAIEAMPPEQQRSNDWSYWLARALRVAGRKEDARALFARIADQADFYGNLASEELGRPIQPPPRRLTLKPEDIQAAAADPGVRRTLALYRLAAKSANSAEIRQDAIREWNWALQGREDAFLLAAAELARKEELFDRAINAANRTVSEHDFSLRFLSPFQERVAPQAQKLALDPAWVYGLMRQESRFVMKAASSAGAQGLMQVMPETARYVARKIGLPSPNRHELNDLDTNITLGTHYLKMVLSDLNNHPVLASAAYNAGPGRARRWRDAKPLEGAIYAETIPCNENRDYVKKVMSNAVYYAALFEGKPQSLKARLGVVPASDGSTSLSPEEAAVSQAER
jgi:soluble lytic murein transglycosylase